MIKLAKNFIRFAVIGLVVGFPFHALSDHVPENMAQELNPNYVGCMMAVEDASTEFRSTLQSFCLGRMGDICSGRNGVALPSQVFNCVYFETQRAVEFLTTAVPDLPNEVEKNGLFGIMYQRRRASLLQDLQNLANQDQPQHFDEAIQQAVKMAAAVETLFWLARETGTPVEAHVQAVDGPH
jgi:hypothetical protein